MEEIIKKIIEMDNTAKSKINTLQVQKDNIENYINDRLNDKKKIIDNKYAYKIKKLQEKYDSLYEERKNKLDQINAKEIVILKEKYENEKQTILNNLIKNII